MTTTFALLLLSGSLAASAGTAPAGTDAAPVVAAAAAALGGAPPLAIPALHESIEGTAVGLPMHGEAYVDLAHGAYAQDAFFGPLRADRGFDGAVAWTRDDKGVVWVDGSSENRSAALNEAYRESRALYRRAFGGATVTLQPARTEAGMTYDVARVLPPGSTVTFDVLFDRATHLPMRYVETAAAVTTTTTLGDYTGVGGFRLPFAMEQRTSEGNVTTVRITHVDLAPRGIASSVRKPVTETRDATIAGGRETSVPFRLVDDHVALDVMLNGKGPFRFLFDTGGANVIDPAIAAEIGSATDGSMQGGGVGATSETFAFAKVASMRIGEALLTDQDFVVLPIRAGFGVSSSERVDGLIGAEVLARYVTTFDYAAGRLTFALPGATPAGTAIPMTFAGTQPLVPCRIDDIAAECTIDSGSRSSLDLGTPFVAAHPDVVPHDVTALGVDGFGVGGASMGRLGRLGSLTLGDVWMPDLIAGFSEASAGAFAVPGIAANIGDRVLERFTVTYDYAHLRVYVRPNAAVGARDVTDRSGLATIRREGAIVVAAVRDGTPAAAAGFAKGDVITAVGDPTGTTVTLGTVRAAFEEPSGTRLHVRVLRGGATSPQTIDLVLRDYV